MAIRSNCEDISHLCWEQTKACALERQQSVAMATVALVIDSQIVDKQTKLTNCLDGVLISFSYGAVNIDGK